MSRRDWTRSALERSGFVGWCAFGDLRAQLRSIDSGAAGVYVVYRDDGDRPRWLDKSPGGTWRGDPSVSQADLVANWVEAARIVYIGKAKANQLRNRLRAYCSFGEGGKGRHYGGRLIWQLEGAGELLVAWRVIDARDDALAVERDLIARFRADFGQRPFANDPQLHVR